MAKAKRITSRGALLAVDVAAVDRLWMSVPAREAIAAVTKTRDAATNVPGVPEPAVSTGLDAALRAFTTKKTLERPLVEALRSRRAIGIPWKWLSKPPSIREEARADERMLRWAEATRLPDISTGDVIVVSSAVERTMIGATDVKDAFSRWGTEAFASALESTPDDAREILLDAWDDAAPLLAVTGQDDEEALWALARARLTDIRSFVRFARTGSLAILPWSPEIFPAFLEGRAVRRAAR